MSAGYVCDRCGAAIFDGENVTLSIDLRHDQPEEGNGLIIATPRSDLCVKCAGAVEDIIRARIITAKTFLEAWLS